MLPRCLSIKFEGNVCRKVDCHCRKARIMTLLACSNDPDQSADTYGKTLKAEQKSAMQICAECCLQGDVTDFRQQISQRDRSMQQLTASV